MGRVDGRLREGTVRGRRLTVGARRVLEAGRLREDAICFTADAPKFFSRFKPWVFNEEPILRPCVTSPKISLNRPTPSFNAVLPREPSTGTIVDFKDPNIPPPRCLRDPANMGNPASEYDGFE